MSGSGNLLNVTKYCGHDVCFLGYAVWQVKLVKY